MKARENQKREGTRSGAQAVHRALTVLNAFTEARPAMTIGEIAGATSLTGPTSHRIVNALTDQGFLARDEVTRRYTIGPAVLRLARLTENGNSAFGFIRPMLESVRAETKETVGLHVHAGARRVCLVELESPHRVRVVSGPGQTYPLTAAAASKAMLAFMPDDRIEAIINATDENVDRERLLAALAETRRRGYACSFGETIPGAHAVAAPVLDGFGHATAAVNVTGPGHRLPRRRLQEIGQNLVERLRALHESRYPARPTTSGRP